MINLGDVNFSLGAETARLQQSIQVLNRFGREVERAQSLQGKGATQTAAAFRRQENAAVNALNKVVNLNNQLSKFQGTDRFILANERAFQRLNNELVKGKLSALEYQRAMERFRNQIQHTQRRFANFATGSEKGAINLVGRMQDIASGFVLINGPLGGTAARIISLTSMLKRSSVQMAAFVAGIAAGVWTVQRLGMAIYEAGKQLKSFESQFNTIFASMIKGSQAVDRAIEIARKTGAAVTEIIPALAKFTAAAQGTSLRSEEIIDLFETVASASTKLNLGVEQQAGIFKALEQMMSKGTIQAEELRGQLGDRLPGAFQIAARAMGKTTAELGVMMKNGQLLADDFLPKFAAELRKTFNIDGSPIDNFASRINNLQTAWFQLRVELDKFLGLTDAVGNVFKSLTQVLDWARVNLDQLVIVAVAASAALLGLSVPAIIGGIASIVVWVTKATFSIGLLNKALNALPMGRFLNILIRSASAIGAAGLAVTKFKDDIYLVKGEVGTLGDYMRIAWSDAQIYVQEFVNRAKEHFQTLKTEWDTVNNLIKSVTELTWPDVMAAVVGAITEIVDTMSKAGQEIALVWAAIRNNILADIKTIATGINNVRKFFSPWIDDFDASDPEAKKGFDWFDKLFANAEYQRKSWEELQKDIADIWAQPSLDAGKLVEAYLDDLRKRANAAGASRDFHRRRVAGIEANRPELDFNPNRNTATAQIEQDSKAIKAAQKRAEAINAMNEAISRTREEIEALGGTEAGLEALTQKFKREKEVEKYARAMRKAGVETEFVKQKSQELLEALELRDKLELQREALTTWRDAWVSAFDQVSATIVDLIFDGSNAMQKLADVARAVARDILNTFLQLAILNPLKNMLFGLGLPTIGGLGVSGGAPMNLIPTGRTGLVYNPIMKYMARGGLLTSPTKMMTAGGPVIGGEAGTEAIMPLSRDSSGKLGVEARGMGGGETITVTFAPTYNVKGNTEDIEALRRQMAKDRAEFEARTLQTIRKARSGRKL